HCVLKWEGGESVSIADSSTNGTYLNESKILKGETRMLRDGNEICLGMKISTKNADPRSINAGYVYRHLAKPPKNELERLFDFDVNIGDGSTAVVHRALHRASGEFFAIKLITFKNVGKFQYDQTKKLVESEIEILKTLDHPHVCSLLMSGLAHVDMDSGIVLPYMNGGNLSIYMNKYPDAEILAKDIAYQVCTGMAYVHEQGVVHRDLKPDNILVTIDEPPFVTIADFGVSKLVEGKQKLRTVCGTPLYAAPELGNAPVAHYTNLVDCFSVGVVIYEM
ncbi:kinase-like protein, partial [Pholiota conissans]